MAKFTRIQTPKTDKAKMDRMTRAIGEVLNRADASKQGLGRYLYVELFDADLAKAKQYKNNPYVKELMRRCATNELTCGKQQLGNIIRVHIMYEALDASKHAMHFTDVSYGVQVALLPLGFDHLGKVAQMAKEAVTHNLTADQTRTRVQRIKERSGIKSPGRPPITYVEKSIRALERTLAYRKTLSKSTTQIAKEVDDAAIPALLDRLAQVQKELKSYEKALKERAKKATHNGRQVTHG